MSDYPFGNVPGITIPTLMQQANIKVQEPKPDDWLKKYRMGLAADLSQGRDPNNPANTSFEDTLINVDPRDASQLASFRQYAYQTLPAQLDQNYEDANAAFDKSVDWMNASFNMIGGQETIGRMLRYENKDDFLEDFKNNVPGGDKVSIQDLDRSVNYLKKKFPRLSIGEIRAAIMHAGTVEKSSDLKDILTGEKRPVLDTNVSHWFSWTSTDLQDSLEYMEDNLSTLREAGKERKTKLRDLNNYIDQINAADRIVKRWKEQRNGSRSQMFNSNYGLDTDSGDYEDILNLVRAGAALRKKFREPPAKK